VQVLRVEGLPQDAVAAAGVFYTQFAPQAQGAEGDMTLVFAPADHAHRGWRLAAVQDLARTHAPRRVNAIESEDPEAITRALAYLTAAPGVTGQVLRLDSQGAGVVIG